MKKDIKFITKKKQKIKFYEEEFAYGGDFRAEMLSNKEISVEGCTGVLEFSDCYIKLKIKSGTLDIYGVSLKINGYEEKTLTVTGEIKSVEFCVREKLNGKHNK